MSAARVRQTILSLSAVLWGATGLPVSAVGQTAEGAGEWRFDGPAFAALSVADLDASVRWYRAVLGAEVVREVEARDGSARVALLRRADLIIELIGHADPLDARAAHGGEPDFRFLGIFKTGLFVRGIDALHAHLLAQDVRADASIGADDTVGARTFIFRDPDGNRLQVFELCDGTCGDDRATC